MTSHHANCPGQLILALQRKQEANNNTLFLNKMFYVYGRLSGKYVHVQCVKGTQFAIKEWFEQQKIRGTHISVFHCHKKTKILSTMALLRSLLIGCAVLTQTLAAFVNTEQSNNGNAEQLSCNEQIHDGNSHAKLPYANLC